MEEYQNRMEIPETREPNKRGRPKNTAETPEVVVSKPHIIRCSRCGKDFVVKGQRIYGGETRIRCIKCGTWHLLENLK